MSQRRIDRKGGTEKDLVSFDSFPPRKVGELNQPLAEGSPSVYDLPQAPNPPFKTGDYVVRGGYGVYKIFGVTILRLDGRDTEVYLVRPVHSGENSGEFFQPVSTASQYLRPIVSTTKALAILKEARSLSLPSADVSWNERYTRSMQMLKTGELERCLEVALDLKRLQEKKKLSFGEQRLFQNAMDYLVTEISLSAHMSEQEVEKAVYEL